MWLSPGQAACTRPDHLERFQALLCSPAPESPSVCSPFSRKLFQAQTSRCFPSESPQHLSLAICLITQSQVSDLLASFISYLSS